MKLLITVVIVLAILGGIALTKNKTTEYVNEAPEVVTKEVLTKEDALQLLIKEAQNASSTEIEAKAKKVYEDGEALARKESEEEKQRLLDEIELRTINEYDETTIETRKVELEKKLGTYWTRERIIGLIKKTFPEDVERALAIAKCESHYNPKAYNGNNVDGSNDGGLWQLNSVHNKRLEALGLDKYKPEDATKFARILYDESGGWGDWVCHTTEMAYR